MEFGFGLGVGCHRGGGPAAARRPRASRAGCAPGAARGREAGQKERACGWGWEARARGRPEGPRERGSEDSRARARVRVRARFRVRVRVRLRLRVPRVPRLERRIEAVVALIVGHAGVGAGREKHARHAGVAHPAGAEQRGVVVVVLNVVPAAVGEEQRDQSHVPLLGRARERRRAKLAAVAWVCAGAQQALGVAQVSPSARVKEGLSFSRVVRQPRARPRPRREVRSCCRLSAREGRTGTYAEHRAADAPPPSLVALLWHGQIRV